VAPKSPDAQNQGSEPPQFITVKIRMTTLRIILAALIGESFGSPFVPQAKVQTCIKAEPIFS